MSDIIQLLSESVSNQIAAGEVIQRPASVVKELVENSIDANATEVKVLIKDGGKTYIQVVDNGCGMSKTDARMCFERFATSKIKTPDDLMTIRTLGFRGEALASIASISKIVLRTRKPDEEIGSELTISGSVVESEVPVACPQGSSFTVKNLFYNIPARRKFLKTNNVEFRHILYDFQRIAIAHPDLVLVLTHNNTEIYNLPVSSYKQRIVHIFGKGINQNLTPVELDTNLIKIRGFIGKPERARKTSGEQYFFINKRFMRHLFFHKAVMTAYEKLIPPETIPSYFIFLEAEPDSVDVNIHPTKIEVKFENETAVYQIINAAIREALGKFNMIPSIDFNREGAFEIPVHQKDRSAEAPSISYNPDYDPFNEEQHQRNFPTNSGMSGSNIRNWEKLYEQDGFYSGKEDRRIDQNSQYAIDLAAGIHDANFIQLKNKYILTSVRSGLMIIDQKRAHERILFESYVKSLALNTPVAQRTLFPETIELDPANYLIMREIAEDLQTIGFDLCDFGSNTFVINGCPVIQNNLTAREFIERFLELYKNTGSDIKISAREKLASSLALANAVDYGEKLTQQAMQEMVDGLFACENPNYSPSGKPVVSIIAIDELEKKLK
ncbi:MAG: DNA mismatch repair endonuclease MutL [Bacteroidales bacterium]|nr:DNA mismatch repair endonuclease MutL [Bacteroidales bacterium]